MDCICLIMAVQMDAATSSRIAPNTAKTDAAVKDTVDFGIPLYYHELIYAMYVTRTHLIIAKTAHNEPMKMR
jgi:hypothetical protein